MTPKLDEKIIGAIAIQRDGHVGIVMELKAGYAVIDGEDVRPDDMRALRVADGNIAIMNYAAELGHDVDAQKAIVEAVRLLREKALSPTLSSSGEDSVAQFDNELVHINSDLPFDKGVFNRAVAVARLLLEDGLWDGKTQIRFDDAYEIHKRVFGFEHFATESLVLQKKNGTIVVSLPAAAEDAIAEVVAQIDELDVRTMDYRNKRVRMADGSTGLVKAVHFDMLSVLPDGANDEISVKKSELLSVLREEEKPQPANLLAIIESLRTEIKLNERELDKLQADVDAKAQMIARLETDLDLEQKARRLAESVAALTTSPSPLGRGEESAINRGEKPYGAKIIHDTSEADLERLWEADWELMHSQFAVDGKLQTMWRKINEYYRPDGSPLRESVALPTFGYASMEDTSPLHGVDVMSLQDADAVLYGSENTLNQEPPSPSPLPQSIGEGESEIVEIAPVLEIAPVDVFERFDGDILKGLPIAQAILKHGVAAVKEMADGVAATAAMDAMAKGNALANLTVREFAPVEAI